jgi:hypothetical protein
MLCIVNMRAGQYRPRTRTGGKNTALLDVTPWFQYWTASHSPRSLWYRHVLGRLYCWEAVDGECFDLLWRIVVRLVGRKLPPGQTDVMHARTAWSVCLRCTRDSAHWTKPRLRYLICVAAGSQWQVESCLSTTFPLCLHISALTCPVSG